MRLEFLPRALDIYKELKASNPSLASKIKSFIADAIEHPATGMGEPTKLAGIYEGLWVRRLSASEEMYYAFDDFKLVVVALSLSHQDSKSETADFSLQAFSDEEYAAVMSQMAANRGKDSEPKVGLF